MIKEECIFLKRLLRGSLVVTVLSILYWLFGVSAKLRVHLMAHRLSLDYLFFSNAFFDVVLPTIGFTCILFVHYRLIKIEKFRRHDIEINKLKRGRNLLLLGYIALMIRGLVFLIYST